MVITSSNIEPTPPTRYIDITPSLTPSLDHTLTADPSPVRWPLALTNLTSFSPPAPPSPDRESDFSLMEKDITTMNLELEIPLDVAPTATVPEPAASHSNESTKIKEEYYIDTVVEDTLFRVPTHYFKASTDFFTQDLESIAAKAAHKEESVLKLEDVTKAEFRALVKLMYPLALTLTRTLSDDEWVSVLKLSTKWMMLDIRQMVIKRVTSANMSPVERIVLARKYSVDTWLRSAYITVAQKVARVSPEDAAKIGLENVFKLHRANEQVLRTCVTTASALDYTSAIQTAFGSEFERMQEAGRNDVERAVLARKCDVMEWLRAAFVELVGRSQSLSVDEARAVGYETAIRLCTARELCITHEGSESSAWVDQELGTELQALRSHSTVERVVLARVHGVAEWLRSALVELVKRQEGVSVDEAALLGLETAIEVCRVRQMPFDIIPKGKILFRYESAVDGEFDSEFVDVRVAGDLYRRLEATDKPATVEKAKEAVELHTMAANPEPEAKSKDVQRKNLSAGKKKKKKK